MKSNLNTELLEYLQQAGKEITKGYIQKTGNKHCKFGVIQFSDIAKPEPDGKPDIIRKQQNYMTNIKEMKNIYIYQMYHKCHQIFKTFLLLGLLMMK